LSCLQIVRDVDVPPIGQSVARIDIRRRSRTEKETERTVERADVVDGKTRGREIELRARPRHVVVVVAEIISPASVISSARSQFIAGHNEAAPTWRTTRVGRLLSKYRGAADRNLSRAIDGCR